MTVMSDDEGEVGSGWNTEEVGIVILFIKSPRLHRAQHEAVTSLRIIVSRRTTSNQ